jgi:hypothetical protein
VARAVGNFSPTNPPESELFTFDFVNDLRPGDSIASVTSWTNSVVEGVDPNVAGTVVGAATIFGTKVTQRMKNWAPGVIYSSCCLVHTAFGDDLDLWALCPDEAVGC